MKRCETIRYAAVLLGVVGAGAARADTIRVPEDHGTIQAAIDAASDGDEVAVADGTWTGALNKNLDFKAKAITLRSASGDRAACIIDCEDDGRLATFGAGDTAVVRSITVENGNAGAGNGGAAFVDTGGSPSFDDCAFRHCDANAGGALFAVSFAEATIERCVFEGNTATIRGGAINTAAATITIVETEFNDNVAGGGGAAWFDAAQVVISGCKFEGNLATNTRAGAVEVNQGGLVCTDSSFTENHAPNHGGGAMHLDGETLDPLRISGCRFTMNDCAGQGGAVVVNAAFDEISNCLFDRNVAGIHKPIGGGGGGLYISAGLSTSRVQSCVFYENTGDWAGGMSIVGGETTCPTIVNCLFVRNRAVAVGGALDVFDSAGATFVNCTFSENTAELNGGALFAEDGCHVRFVNCVLWGDEAPEGPEIQIGHECCPGGTVTVRYSDVAGGEDGVVIGPGGSLEWGDGNIDCEDDGRFATLGDGDAVVVRDVTIRNGNSGAAAGGAFRLDSGASVTIDGCALRENTTTSSGGAVYAIEASVTLIDTKHEDNEADKGGAASFTSSETTISGSSFTRNHAVDGHGGGLAVIDGELVCTDSSFTANRSSNAGGGAFWKNTRATVRISGCTFTSNQGDAHGGAAAMNGVFEMSNCLFRGNDAGPFMAGGGALWINVSFPTARVQDCVFLENTAVWAGGVDILGGSAPTFVNCLFARNQSEEGGAADIWSRARATFINCTFLGNRARTGGAITAGSYGHVQLVNCVLWGNDAPIGPEIQVGTDYSEGGTVTVSYSDVAGGEDGVWTEHGGTLEWGDGNIDADPLFVDDEGRIGPGSRVIDAGDNEGLAEDVSVDLDANPRFMDDAGTQDTGNPDAAVVDMGAYEFQGTSCLGDLDGSGAVGFGDVLAILAAWGNAGGPEDLDDSGTVDFGDLLVVLAAWGPCA